MNHTNFILYRNRVSKLREREDTPTFRNSNFCLLSSYSPVVHWNRHLCVHPLPTLKKVFIVGKVLITKLGRVEGFFWVVFSVFFFFFEKKKLSCFFSFYWCL